MLQAECGVARLIDDHKRKTFLNIFKEILTASLNSSIVELGPDSRPISVSIDQNVGEHEMTFVLSLAMNTVSTVCIWPNICGCVEMASEVSDDTALRILEEIQRFNELLDCRCNATLGSCKIQSSTLSTLEVEGISAALLEEGNCILHGVANW